MGGGLESVLDAYVAAWNTVDAGERSRLLDQAVSDDFVFAGPTGLFRGRDAVDGLITAMQQRMPDTAVVRVGPAEPADVYVEFGWEIRAGSGTRLLAGTDAGELGADGRLTRVEMKTMGA